MKIAEQLVALKKTLPEDVTLVAVSKTKPVKDLEMAYAAGQRIFGENKVQELVTKWESLPRDISWHMIGHLQRNKVKYIAPFVSLIHGVDSLRLLKEVNKQGEKNQRKIDCLLQMHIAEESTKFGLSSEELHEILDLQKREPLPYINITGLMGMATFTNDEHQIRREFRQLKVFFDQTKEILQHITILSMGMSGDYLLAIEEGSTMIRVGSKIFGERNY